MPSPYRAIFAAPGTKGFSAAGLPRPDAAVDDGHRRGHDDLPAHRAVRARGRALGDASRCPPRCSARRSPGWSTGTGSGGCCARRPWSRSPRWPGCCCARALRLAGLDAVRLRRRRRLRAERRRDDPGPLGGALPRLARSCTPRTPSSRSSTRSASSSGRSSPSGCPRPGSRRPGRCSPPCFLRGRRLLADRPARHRAGAASARARTAAARRCAPPASRSWWPPSWRPARSSGRSTW